MNLLALTNPISASLIADAVLITQGRTPIMSHAVGELPAWLPHITSALINLGALDPQRRAGADWLSRQSLPFVLDPVGISADSSRRAFAKILLSRRPALVKANASEMAALFELEEAPTAGIDSVASPEGVAAHLSNPPVPLLITGATDLLLLPGGAQQRVVGGHESMRQVVGLGCALGAVIAAYLPELGAEKAALKAARAFKRAGEQAGQIASGPASFRLAFLDALAT